jgi:hypothetical protein
MKPVSVRTVPTSPLIVPTPFTSMAIRVQRVWVDASRTVSPIEPLVAKDDKDSRALAKPESIAFPICASERSWSSGTLPERFTCTRI